MEFQQYWPILKRRWLPASLVFISVTTLCAGSLTLQKNVYQADGKIRFTRGDRATTLTGVGKEMGQFDPLVETNNPLTTEMDVIRSMPIIQTTIDRLDLRDLNGKRLLPREFLRNLSLINTRGTDILQLSYRHENPAKAKAIVDTLIATYLGNHLQANRAQAVAARKFIEQQLPEAEARVQLADANLRQFKEANQVAALEEEGKVTVAALGELRKRVADVRAELANANAESAAFSSQLGMNPQAAIAVVALSQSPGVQEVLKQVQAIEAQLAVERVRFQDSHPIVKKLQERKDNLEALLNQRIGHTLNGQSIDVASNLQIGELRAALVGDFVHSEVKRMGLANQATALANAEAFYQQKIATFPRLEQEQHELTRRLEAAQATYSLLLQKLHEARVAENQNVGNARVIQPAFVLDKPVSPRPVAYLATGGIVGLLLALGTALLLESRDKSIRTVKEARELFGFTLLGVIPLDRSCSKHPRSAWNASEPSSEVVVKLAPHSAISGAYQMLQANLKFLTSDRALKTIVVTSSVADEGKSVVSANLAMTRAQMGYKVLLIDADLWYPSQHQIWGLLNDTGLSHWIVEQMPLETVIKTPVANLDVLTAGVVPPNPTVLLDSQRMITLIEQVSQTYDFVIIDTPSLNVAADAPILGRMSDGVLLVTRPGVINAVSAAFAKERLEHSNQTVLGQVINGIIPENEPHSYYYFTHYASPERAAAQNLLPRSNPAFQV